MQEVETMKVFDLRKSIYDEVLRDSGYAKNDPPEHFHPSSAGYCMRQMFISKVGIREFDLPSKGSMKVGTIIHRWVQEEILSDVPVAVEKDVKSPEILGVYFKGRIDVLVNDKVPYDIKSFGGFSLPKAPKGWHIIQLNTYMGIVGATTGYLLYISKFNLACRTFEVKFDEDLYKFVFMKAFKIKTAIEEWDGDVKNIPFDKCGDKKCYGCKKEVLSNG